METAHLEELPLPADPVQDAADDNGLALQVRQTGLAILLEGGNGDALY
ncbi:MAG TPA: hypothetical protein VKA46_15535 [Gemmataceae bacterium]|nr:hypothetical protein [Gemmataceae bacterium]